MTHHSWTWEHYTTAEGRPARGVVEVLFFFDAVGDPTIFVDAFGEMLDSPEKARFLEWDTLDKEEEIEAAIQTALKNGMRVGNWFAEKPHTFQSSLENEYRKSGNILSIAGSLKLRMPAGDCKTEKTL